MRHELCRNRPKMYSSSFVRGSRTPLGRPARRGTVRGPLEAGLGARRLNLGEKAVKIHSQVDIFGGGMGDADHQSRLNLRNLLGEGVDMAPADPAPVLPSLFMALGMPSPLARLRCGSRPRLGR